MQFLVYGTFKGILAVLLCHLTQVCLESKPNMERLLSVFKCIFGTDSQKMQQSIILYRDLFWVLLLLVKHQKTYWSMF